MWLNWIDNCGKQVISREIESGSIGDTTPTTTRVLITDTFPLGMYCHTHIGPGN
jgi:hypothetical protein